MRLWSRWELLLRRSVRSTHTSITVFRPPPGRGLKSSTGSAAHGEHKPWRGAAVAACSEVIICTSGRRESMPKKFIPRLQMSKWARPKCILAGKALHVRQSLACTSKPPHTSSSPSIIIIIIIIITEHVNKHRPGPTTLFCRYNAITLSKMEAVLNIVSLGYSPLWLDTDIVHMRSPLPFVAELEARGVHVAVSAENCATIMRRSLDEGAHEAVDLTSFDHNTGILFVSSAPRAVRSSCPMLP